MSSKHSRRHTIRRALQAAPARRVTVDQHQAFRRAIAPPPDLDDDAGPALDFIDNPRERRREREIARLLHILDTLPPAREEMERSRP
jgi:hypothetical protein